MNNMNIQAGKSYHLHSPHFGFQNNGNKVHIDYILDNPKHDGKNSKLIISRVWLKHKKRQHWSVDPYYVWCIWNKWEYKNG